MSALSQIRDVLQQRLLTHLYRGTESSSLVLKGGAAMRVLTESARYTQDLDFDHDPHRPLASLQRTVRSAIDRALQGSGLTEIAISEPKQTDTVARWKISGRTPSGEHLHLTVEVSRRRAPDPPSVTSLFGCCWFGVSGVSPVLPCPKTKSPKLSARATNRITPLLASLIDRSAEIVDNRAVSFGGLHASSSLNREELDEL